MSIWHMIVGLVLCALLVHSQRLEEEPEDLDREDLAEMKLSAILLLEIIEKLSQTPPADRLETLMTITTRLFNETRAI
ncbi:hypothetical protein AAHC03_018962 [Spirometra sp. Aus1]